MDVESVGEVYVGPTVSKNFDVKVTGKAAIQKPTKSLSAVCFNGNGLDRVTEHYREDLAKLFEPHDFITLLETHLRAGDLAVQFSGFRELHKPRISASRGGISMYFRLPITLTEIANSSEDLLCVRISFEKQSFVLIGVYLLPSNSSLNVNEGLCSDELQRLLASFTENVSVMLCGF